MSNYNTITIVRVPKSLYAAVENWEGSSEAIAHGRLGETKQSMYPYHWHGFASIVGRCR